MTVGLTVLGAAILIAALRETFSTLFHPQGRGVLSEGLVRIVWAGTRPLGRVRPGARLIGGPIAFLAVVSSWGLMVVVGFALLFWPHMPDDFAQAAAVPGQPQGFLDALYLSAVNITSLGYGDIVPTTGMLRILGTLETIVGLALLTASISWLVSIYGALSAYRAASHEIGLLLSDLPREELEGAGPVLGRICSALVATRRDLMHFPIAYYFRAPDPRYSLWEMLPRLFELTARCRGQGDPDLRLEATRTESAATDLLESLNDEFLELPETATVPELLAAYRRDHP